MNRLVDDIYLVPTGSKLAKANCFCKARPVQLPAANNPSPCWGFLSHLLVTVEEGC